jgi:amino acid transporter
MASGDDKEKRTTGHGFGTFKGVFTPSVLTILGVIMYLRFGWVLANVGPLWTIVIVTLATSVTFLTALSISALATNMRVGGGGAYFIISRSLGLEAGSAIGLPLFFAQAFGISFYIAGFAESLVDFYPGVEEYIPFGMNPDVAVGIAALVATGALAFFSASLALRTQYFILGLIVFSLVSFFAGSAPQETPAFPPGGEASIVASLKTIPGNFWMVFAVFFPAVTGIEAGLAMSGDLKNPAKSLPWGTFGAIGASYAVYIAIPLFMGSLIPWTSAEGAEMLKNSLVMRDIAKWGLVVVFAIWGACLSSAMGAMLGAPRTLQALAKDTVVPRFIGRGYGKGNDPRIATAISFAIALSGILLGGINLIAPVLSMFFLTSYCLLNVSSAFEGFMKSPTWRPAFNTHWAFSLAGALLCLGIMIQISFFATLAALVVAFAVYYVMKRRRLAAHWGDARYGVLMLLCRDVIYRLARKKPDARSWRPNILVLTGSPSSRWRLVEIADAIASKNGFLTVSAVLAKNTDADRLDDLETAISSLLAKKEVDGLVKVVAAKTVMDGITNLLRYHGFGPLTPNTVLLGAPDPDKKDAVVDMAKLVSFVAASKLNVAIVSEPGESCSSDAGNGENVGKRRIDVWWGGKTNSGALMVSLAYLMKTHQEWSKVKLVINSIAMDEDQRLSVGKKLDAFLERSRLDAEARVVDLLGGDVFETIAEHSKNADLVFLGIRPPGEKEKPKSYIEYYTDLVEKTRRLPCLVKTLAAEDVDFQKIFK